MLGVDFEVHEPPELVERLRELAARFERAASGAGVAGRPAGYVTMGVPSPKASGSVAVRIDSVPTLRRPRRFSRWRLT